MLLDSCVIIDVLRGRKAALAFVSNLPDTPSLSVITVTEIVAGIRDRTERRQIDRLFENYRIHDVDLEIAGLAGDYVRQYGRSHAVDPVDALIAATAKLRDLPFATLNLKHFPMFSGLEKPYR